MKNTINLSCFEGKTTIERFSKAAEWLRAHPGATLVMEPGVYEISTPLARQTMNEALSGGNSKVCGQLFAYGNGDYETTLKYYKALSGGRQIEEKMLETIAGGVANMWDTIKDKFYNGDTSGFLNTTGVPAVGHMSPEYPEMPGAEKVCLVGTNLTGGVRLYDAVYNTMMTMPIRWTSGTRPRRWS